jgi:hypothetical protein
MMMRMTLALVGLFVATAVGAQGEIRAAVRELTDRSDRSNQSKRKGPPEGGPLNDPNQNDPNAPNVSNDPND